MITNKLGSEIVSNYCDLSKVYLQDIIWLYYKCLLALQFLANFNLAQEAIVSEITRQTNPTGKSALVHHRRKFLQSLQKPRKLPIIIVWIILIGFSSTLKIWKIHNLHLHSKNSTLKSWFNESRFTKIPRFSEQMPAPLNYFTKYIVNSIWFSELHNLVNKSGLIGLVR